VARLFAKVGGENEEVKAALVRFLESNNSDYRALAADRLAELGPQGKVAVPVLIERLKVTGLHAIDVL
jgi:hypothetical protein